MMEARLLVLCAMLASAAAGEQSFLLDWVLDLILNEQTIVGFIELVVVGFFFKHFIGWSLA